LLSGPAALAGVGVMLLVIPVNVVVVSKVRKLQIANMRIKDHRLKLMSEVLNGIKVWPHVKVVGCLHSSHPIP
jgi:hypothetical protein